MQPLANHEELVDFFGKERVRRCLKLALDVHLTGSGIGTYKAEVDNQSVEYDAMMLPGVTSCTCDDFTVQHHCDHVVAVAIIVLGCGEIPEFTQLDSDLQSMDDSELIDSLPERDLREILHSQLHAAAPLSIALRLRAKIESALPEPFLDDDGVRFAPIIEAEENLAQSELDEFDISDRIAEFIATAEPFQQAGYGPRCAHHVVNAILHAQTRIQGLEDPSERVFSACDDLFGLLSQCASPHQEELASFVKQVIAREKENEEFIILSWLFRLLDDEQLKDLISWLTTTQEITLKNWGRAISIAEKLQLRDIYEQLMADVPREAWNLAVTKLIRKQCTPARIVMIRRYFNEGLFSFDHSTEAYGAESVLDWLASSTDVQASELFNDMACALFDPRHPWPSFDALSSVRPLTDADEVEIMHNARSVLNETDLRLLKVILQTYLPDTASDSQLISRQEAALIDFDKTWIAFERLQGSFPVAAVNLGLGSIECKFQVLPETHAAALVRQIEEVESVACESNTEQVFHNFLAEFIPKASLRADLHRELRKAGYIGGMPA